MTDRHEAAVRAALAERDRLVYPANEAVADWVIESIVEAALAVEWSHPHYTSTYCIHELHDDCRLTCKHCKTPCRCGCHER